jgi:hypothetical protein
VDVARVLRDRASQHGDHRGRQLSGRGGLERRGFGSRRFASGRLIRGVRRPTAAPDHDFQRAVAGTRQGDVERSEIRAIVGYGGAAVLGECRTGGRPEVVEESVDRLGRHGRDGETEIGVALDHPRPLVRGEPELGRSLLDHDPQHAVDRLQDMPLVESRSMAAGAAEAPRTVA